MEIKSRTYEKEEPLRYKLVGSRHTTSYRTVKGNVLKIFDFNNYYQDILNRHNNNFLEYLKYLSSINFPLFITPDTVYMHDEKLVRSYKREYVLGTSLGDLYPKTSIEPLIEHIAVLYKELESIPEINLNGLTAKDMIYTGESIYLTDFDLSTFNDENNVEKNIKLLDKAIFIGLFNCNPSSLDEINEYYRMLVKKLTSDDYHITDFLSEYLCDLSNIGKSQKYLRTLKNNLLK